MSGALALATTTSLELAKGHEASRAITRAGSRSFFFASHALDAERRAAAYALYAFFRGADDAADAEGSADARRHRIDRQRAALARIWSGAPTTPTELSLAWAAERFAIPRRPIEQLLEAVEGDVGRVRLQTWKELDAYCFGVASTVGLAMAPLLGAPAGSEGQAAALGHAMQLTNILRDVKEDLVSLDRIYLPAEALEAHGIGEAELRGSAPTPAFRALGAELAVRAHALFDASEPGIRVIAPWRSRLTVRLMRVTYREILCEAQRREFDVFRERIVVPTSRKVSLALQVLIGRDPAMPGRRA